MEEEFIRREIVCMNYNPPSGSPDNLLLVEIKKDIGYMARDLAELKVSHKDAQKDVEIRLRALENFRWYLMGIASIMGFIAGLFAKRFN